jgi:rod shape-determining protein MreC
VLIAPEHFASRRDTIAFALCILLSIGARAAPSTVQDKVVKAIRSTVLAPFLSLEHGIENEKAVHLRAAHEMAIVDSARVQALETLELQQENESLRSLLGLSARIPVEHVAAEVLRSAQPGEEFRTLTLSAGRNKGIEVKDPVVALGGLVGHIVSVGSVTSNVLLWTDLNFRASAVTEARSASGEGGRPVYGIIAPLGGARPNNMFMELSGIPYLEEVPVGARVFTSGAGAELGGVYPRGIPIGTVVREEDELEGWSRTYRVQPAVPIASVSHVIVLTGVKDDVSAAFEGGGT